ncbi:SufE family protein [Amorphus orientalis]|uniref:Cysteine desulfuration protein SufE n=1 Tax=Amorphus orientalis TaxID=649198 RepID=A0AAE3VN41_9HYPH|nr:SufE family protein [Amorphus orientalis]MDQ0315113.1 cysteine desulfuration protein SufE [Amorphus orientalis]
MTEATPDIAEIIEAFELIDDWEERYRYVIELGKNLPEFPEAARTDANKVRGCVSQVWLETTFADEADGPHLYLKGDSDALIVRGLVAILLALYSGGSARTILETDAEATLATLGLREHLTPQRSNGLSAMVQRIRRDADAALAAA